MISFFLMIKGGLTNFLPSPIFTFKVTVFRWLILILTKIQYHRSKRYPTNDDIVFKTYTVFMIKMKQRVHQILMVWVREKGWGKRHK